MNFAKLVIVIEFCPLSAGSRPFRPASSGFVFATLAVEAMTNSEAGEQWDGSVYSVLSRAGDDVAISFVLLNEELCVYDLAPENGDLWVR